MNNNAVAIDKRVVVFAGNGSLASSAARRLAGAGATVLLSGRSKEKTEKVAERIRADGGSVETSVVDPTDPGQVRAFMSEVAADGPVDFAFNGIGLPGPATGYGIPYDDLDPKVMTDAVALVLGSQFLTAREAARVMRSRGYGSIATIASTNGRSGRPHTGGIGVIAGALEALARSLASEYGPYGIRVNHLRATRVGNQDVYPENAYHRPIHPDEVAATLVWLASDLSTGVAGQTIEVSGGENGLAEKNATP
jgi:NAD(P)-dependent dehydrogenase (short-subunit alcohol dehydrogenase family)